MHRQLVVKRVLRASLRTFESWKRVLLFRKFSSSAFRTASLLHFHSNRSIKPSKSLESAVLRPLSTSTGQDLTEAQMSNFSARQLRTFSGRQSSSPSHPPRIDEALKAKYEEFLKQPSVDSAQQLIRQCGYKQHLLAWEVYHALLKAGHTPNTEIIALLARASTAANQPEKAIPYLWEELKRFSLPITEDCFHWLAYACSKAGDDKTASQLLALAKERPRELLANPIITTYLCLTFRAGRRLDKALELLDMSDQITPGSNLFPYRFLFNICTDTKNLAEGERLHKRLIEKRVDITPQDVTALITMYSRCGKLDEAIAVFKTHFDRVSADPFVWNAMIMAYRDYNQMDEAFKLLNRMSLKGLTPNNTTLAVLLTYCNTAPMTDTNMERIKLIHSLMKDHTMPLNRNSATALITSYCKTGNVSDAEAAFNNFIRQNKNEISAWSAMISGYAHNGLGAKGLELFRRMVREGLRPTDITMTAVLNGCAKVGLVDEALSLYRSMEKEYGITPNSRHASCVVVALVDAQRNDELLQFLRQLREIDNHVLNYPLSKCNDVALLNEVYSLAQKHNVKLNHIIVTSLVDRYAKHGQLDRALEIFNANQATHENVSVWNALIHGYSIAGHGTKALETFRSMLQKGVRPDAITMTAVLSGCAKAGLADEALSLYRSMEEYGITPNSRHASCVIVALDHAERYDELLQFIAQLPVVDNNVLLYPLTKCKNIQVVDKMYSIAQQHNIPLGHAIVSSLIDTFSRNGRLDKAVEIFNGTKATEKDVSVWTTMINAYGTNGQWKEAMEVFHNMVREGVKPDAVTMTVVLNGCAKAGLVDKALSLYRSMEKEYGIAPNEAHRSSVKKALTEAGRTEEANQL